MEHSISTLVQTIVLVLGASIVVVALCQRFRIPAVVGYIITGVLIGPHGLGWIKDAHSIHLLSEIGVVLLLFSLGVEFSPAQMLQFRHFVFRGGAVQIVGTGLICFFGALVLGYSILQAFALAMIISLSSTAVGVKLLKQRIEEGSTHGQLAIVILLLQDAVAPLMMALMPLLGGGITNAAAGTVLLLLAGMVGVYFAARAIMPTVLRWLMAVEAREISVLGSLLIALLMGLATESVGLSPALGAFIAGMVISQTPYKHQITSNIVSFRDSFIALFFISVGLMVNLPFIFENVAIALGWTFVIIAGKWVIVVAAARFLCYRPLRVGLMAGAFVANIGEFSFVLIGQAQQLLPPYIIQVLIASTSFSILLTPLLVMAADRLTYRWVELSRTIPPKTPDILQEHIIIVGYGLNGRNLAKVLHELDVQMVVIELNGALVRQAQQDGVPVIYGDGANTHVLEAAGVGHARAVVIGISDPLSTRYTVAHIRQLNPTIPIIVRTRYVPEIEQLRALGATEVVAEEFEAFIEITERILQLLHIQPALCKQVVNTCRQQHYQRLRGGEENISHEEKERSVHYTKFPGT